MKMKSVKIFGKSVPVLALALISVTAVAAGTWIWSNQVTVHVTERPPPPLVYTLTLSAPGDVYVNEVMTFTGSLKVDSTGVSGATIDILDMSSAQVVSTATTTEDGTFTCSYTPTAVGTYNFKAKYIAP